MGVAFPKSQESVKKKGIKIGSRRSSNSSTTSLERLIKKIMTEKMKELDIPCNKEDRSNPPEDKVIIEVLQQPIRNPNLERREDVEDVFSETSFGDNETNNFKEESDGGFSFDPVALHNLDTERGRDLNEFHEEMDIFGVELGGQILDGLMQVLRQQIGFASYREFLPPDLFDVLFRTSPLHSLSRYSLHCYSSTTRPKSN
ncbi:hypothetical protein ACLOJK_018899 [Asimina triloba]